jgi:phosphatidylglycerol:prolipoprotein diacylglycerol transferase
MHPEILRIHGFVISSFGLMLMVAFTASYFQLRWGMRRLGAGDEEDAATLVLAAGFGGIIGAKVYYAVLYGDWHLLFSRSGLVWYGGFLLAAAALVWIMRRRQLPTWPTVDALSLSLALGYALGRVGCFLVGDDYGVPTDLPWGVVFPPGAAPPSTAGALRYQFGVDVPSGIPDSQLLAVHPTQLYETLICLGIWAFGLWLVRRRPRSGVTGMAVLALLGVERFAVELLRAKDDRFIGGLTVAQLISVVVVLVSLWLLSRRRHAAVPSD